MYRLAFALLACCSSSQPPAPSAPPTPGSAAPSPAPRGPTTYAFRNLASRTGGLVLDSFKLTIEGTRATLDMTGKDNPMSATGGEDCEQDGKPVDCKVIFDAAWSTAIGGSMTGTAQKQPTGYQLELPRERGPSLVNSCTEESFDVAPPTAVIVEKPNCAPLSWSKPTARVRLLACRGSSRPMYLAPPPGIEQVHLLDRECSEAAPMLRRVAADESVAPLLAP